MKYWKEQLPRILVSINHWKNRWLNHFLHMRFRKLPIQQVFSIIHHENHWNDSESKSGTGSSLENTQNVRKIFSDYLNAYNIRSLLDIPCGDFNWMSKVDLSNVKYIGADIVPALVDSNQQKYPEFTFQHLDLTKSKLPTVDAIFCRDCLVHLSYADILNSIYNIKQSNSRYLITTTFPLHQNYNIITGNWRPINLCLPPFNFPPPLKINAEVALEGKEYADKSLAIWELREIQIDNR